VLALDPRVLAVFASPAAIEILLSWTESPGPRAGSVTMGDVQKQAYDLQICRSRLSDRTDDLRITRGPRPSRDAQAAPIAPIIALMALARWDYPVTRVHEPVHARDLCLTILLLSNPAEGAVPRLRAGPSRRGADGFTDRYGSPSVSVLTGRMAFPMYRSLGSSHRYPARPQTGENVVRGTSEYWTLACKEAIQGSHAA